jgi:hypothetical protein
MGDNFGIHRPKSDTQGQILSDFLPQLEGKLFFCCSIVFINFF